MLNTPTSLPTGVPTRLAQVAVTASPVAIFTVAANQRAAIEHVQICNTTNSAITLNVYIGSAATAANALAYGLSIAANSVTQWPMFQVLNGGETITVSAGGLGLTITISGFTSI